MDDQKLQAYQAYKDARIYREFLLSGEIDMRGLPDLNHDQEADRLLLTAKNINGKCKYVITYDPDNFESIIPERNRKRTGNTIALNQDELPANLQSAVRNIANNRSLGGRVIENFTNYNESIAADMRLLHEHLAAEYRKKENGTASPHK